MRVVGWTFTRNAFTHGRDGWLPRVVEALAEADEVILFDHNSDDGSDGLVESLGGFRYVSPDGNTTIGRAMNVGHQAAAVAAGPDGLVVTAQDDIVWRPGWRAKLEAFWTDGPDDVGLVCGLLEPDFPWARPTGTVTAGGQTALVRPTVPGGAWTYRGAMWGRMAPANEIKPSHDMPICRRLTAQGLKLAALDLADNLGAHKSTWGNESYANIRPLDRAVWGLV